MNTENEKAYVLHTRQYRESSQLVDLFSRDFGRLRTVAKGARGKRKSGGHQLQAFTPLLLSWRGKGELKNLTAVEASGNNAALHGEMLYIGLYLNELLVRLLPEHVAHESLFDRYSDLIAQLSMSSDPEPLLRRFELSLLEEIGYGLDMATELATDRPIEAGEHYYFTHDQGFIRFDAVSNQCKEGCFAGEHLLAIAADDYCSLAVRRCAKRLLRSALQAQLGERPLLSRQLFHQAKVPVNKAQDD
ncbi:MAG: DNA repair protein RecO [Gammaproteobacteria bacterium]|nr:DNA repair protein RecO [Gammaproteobacteria bacterium]MBQ0839782.1 DNA repair protein RecO [Gammaproteobacteria bacterium]